MEPGWLCSEQVGKSRGGEAALGRVRACEVDPGDMLVCAGVPWS